MFLESSFNAQSRIEYLWLSLAFLAKTNCVYQSSLSTPSPSFLPLSRNISNNTNHHAQPPPRTKPRVSNFSIHSWRKTCSRRRAFCRAAICSSSSFECVGLGIDEFVWSCRVGISVRLGSSTLLKEAAEVDGVKAFARVKRTKRGRRAFVFMLLWCWRVFRAVGFACR